MGQPIPVRARVWVQSLKSNRGTASCSTPFFLKNTYDEETNTYHVYHSNGYVQYSITNKVYVKYYEGINVFMYEGIKIQYVHQLQHLLSISDYKPLSF